MELRDLHVGFRCRGRVGIVQPYHFQSALRQLFGARCQQLGGAGKQVRPFLAVDKLVRRCPCRLAVDLLAQVHRVTRSMQINSGDNRRVGAGVGGWVGGRASAGAGVGVGTGMTSS